MSLRALQTLAALVRERAPRVVLLGCDGPFAACAVAAAAREVPAASQPLVAVVATEPEAIALARDVEFFLGDAGDDPAAPAVLHLPAVETSPYAEVSPDRGAIQARLATLFRLSQGGGGAVLVASTAALLRRVIPRAAFGALCDLVLPEEEVDRGRLVDLCARAGYVRVPVVEDPGTFAVRGGVIDVFPPLYRYPARIDLLGDLVESLRSFDPRSQRTLRDLEALYVHPVRETVRTPGADPRAKILAAADAAAHPSARTRALLEQIEAGEDFFGVEALAPAFHPAMAPIDEYLPADARWLVLDPDAVRRAAAEEAEDLERRFRARREDHRIALEPREHALAPEELDAMLARAPALVEARALEVHDPAAAPVPVVRCAAEPNRELAQALARARAEKATELLRPLVGRVSAYRAEGGRVALVCPSEPHADRLASLLAGHDLEVDIRRRPGAAGLFDLAPGGRPTVFLGPLAQGFHLPSDGLLVVAEEEIFGPRAHARRKASPAARRAADAFAAGASDFSDLRAGDYLVHAVHGVGLYHGLAKLPISGTPIDFLHIEYEGGAFYLPVWRLSEVVRYVGAEGAQPRLDRLGGVTWEKTRRKVSAEVRKLAEELLQLYAQRMALPGHAYPPADALFHEFEATFPFEETPDQDRAIGDVLSDMEQARPMDRLVCGDVGYGKTEVALRAALKAVLGGKQAALLAPTTVLVEQHLGTFRERFRGWPVRVAGLSRFSSRAEQVETLRELGEGRLDVVVGTHRLLSNDVRFKDLGLLIIDEEQRFGVAHKERLKKLRTQVDVLTLTATPIPRTLHMGLMGLREVSIIATPPADRLAIRTYVCRPDDDVIAEGIRRELARGGQVFFVCHRIGEGAGPRVRRRRELASDRSLAEWAEHIRELVPQARVAVGHGQMDPETLEKVMVEFVDHRHDVLVCTTIIESGLDIPRANTMFVSRADAFGLAQLYQLRGRIGRSRERAFCYLMIPPENLLTREAKQRLQVLQRFSELGAGFQIATHDLEIRGAGDLLGAEQSGQIAAVGFDTYARILEEAVAELKGEPLAPERDPELNVDLPGYIPDEYVPDTGQRLDLYKRLAGVAREEDVAALLEEIADRYGEVPDEVKLLGELMLVKAHGRRLGAVSIEVSEQRLALALDSSATPLDPDRVMALVSRKRSPYRLTPDMRLIRAFTEAEKADRVRAAKRALLELLDCAN